MFRARYVAVTTVIVAALLGSGGGLTGTAGAAAPAPAYSMFMLSGPTIFPAAPAVPIFGSASQIEVQAKNVGGAPTSGSFEMSLNLPPGLTVGEQFKGQVGEQTGLEFSHAMTCGAVGQTVTCIGEEPFLPSATATMTVLVEVEPGFSGDVTSTATISGGGGAYLSKTLTTEVAGGPSPFSFLSGTDGLFASATTEEGAVDTQAGSHPYQLSVRAGFAVNSAQENRELIAPEGGLRRLSVELPQGTAVDPQAVPTCKEAEFSTESCPPASQVGLISLGLTGGGRFEAPKTAAVFNIAPPPGAPAVLGFSAETTTVHLVGHVRSDGSYRLSANVGELTSKLALADTWISLWGSPSDSSHDSQRRPCDGNVFQSCPVEPNPTAFLTLPTDCTTSSPVVDAAATDWEDEATHRAAAVLTDRLGNPTSISGCGRLAFEPTVDVNPTTLKADSPTGLSFGLHVPQNEEYVSLSTANLRDVRVSLPPGLVVNPSAANGLQGCSESQIGRAPDEEGHLRFTEMPASCPPASKIGTVAVTTPLLGHPLPGSIYLASPTKNPFGSLLALYIAVEDEQSGIIAKLGGEVSPDPSSGQLTASFVENPELPLEDIDLEFFGGENATLTTPFVCGNHTTTSVLTPWSSPEGADAHPTSTFAISSAAGGGSCPASEASAPNTPGFTAGTASTTAGAFSPFVLRLTRGDGTQHLFKIDTTLPYGLVGKLAGIPYCPESSIALARSREARDQGAVEITSPSCPKTSEVGSVTVGAGSGGSPFYVTGHAYLAGPYEGAPISLVVITPAVAGPFDLGDVVIRVALNVDQRTAQIHAVSDHLPMIIDGIPLDVRSIELKLDRADFTLNPTSCDPMQVAGAITSPAGQTASVSNRFQVGGCSALPFAPRLSLRVFGKTDRNAKPRLKAVLTTKPGEANIRRAQINLPHSLFLEQNHIKTVCTRVQFAEGNGNGSACPQGSVYGRARAWTPLLDHPLEGLVFLRSNGGERKLPDLVAALNGQIQIALQGKVDSGRNQGLRNTFEVVPDAPVSRFVLEMNGKKKGLLVNSENLCSNKGRSRRAIVRFTGQNGKVEQFKPKIADNCGAGNKKHKRRHK